MTTTSSREDFEMVLRITGAVRLPVRGIKNRYRGFQYDDFGNRQAVFISSTEAPNSGGDITWSEVMPVEISR